MKYTSRKQLTVVEIDEDTESIPVEQLAQVLFAQPSNMIYCEFRNKLLGIISTGDIYRAFADVRDMRGQYDIKTDKVMINKSFSFVHVGEHVAARRIFKEKENINALPVISEDGRLIGDYTRWDDIVMLQNILNAGGGYISENWKERKITLVRPCNNNDEKQIILNRFKERLEDQNIEVQCIDSSEMVHCLKSGAWVVVVDENEKRAWSVLLMIAGDENEGRFNKVYTYKDILAYNTGYLGIEKCAAYFKKLYNQGICIMGLTFEESAYSRCLEKEIYDKFASIGSASLHVLRKPLYRDFFDDMYSEEYADDILSIPFACDNSGGVLHLRDYKSSYYNVENGERRTTDQPEYYGRSIYFLGACYIYGHWVEDKNTIESFLQKHLTDDGKAVRVVNCGSPGMVTNYSYMARMMTTELKKGDIIVIGSLEKGIEGVQYLDLNKILEKNKVGAKWLINNFAGHCNHRVHKLYADAIYEALEPALSEKIDGQGTVIEKDTNFIKMLYLDSYFADFNASDYDQVGSIVMNCNPFTYGHRYLIERALETVDFLIIFVVEEDLSLFSFTERFIMVREGTADIKNVMVVPSGPFILSQMSFPEYFIKETSEDIVEHMKQDITTFAEKIAPQLGIGYRFVGEEPEDAVTSQYNMAMKNILPNYGIKLIEIPRKTADGKYISASSVRKYMEENDNDNLVKLLPITTRSLLGLEIGG